MLFHVFLWQSNMRILVTGGAGFIGSHLVDRLMENEKNEVSMFPRLVFFLMTSDQLREKKKKGFLYGNISA